MAVEDDGGDENTKVKDDNNVGRRIIVLSRDEDRETNEAEKQRM